MHFSRQVDFSNLGSLTLRSPPVMRQYILSWLMRDRHSIKGAELLDAAERLWLRARPTLYIFFSGWLVGTALSARRDQLAQSERSAQDVTYFSVITLRANFNCV